MKEPSLLMVTRPPRAVAWLRAALAVAPLGVPTESRPLAASRWVMAPPRPVRLMLAARGAAKVGGLSMAVIPVSVLQPEMAKVALNAAASNAAENWR